MGESCLGLEGILRDARGEATGGGWGSNSHSTRMTRMTRINADQTRSNLFRIDPCKPASSASNGCSVLSVNAELLANGDDLAGPDIVGGERVELEWGRDDALEHLERLHPQVRLAAVERIGQRRDRRPAAL